MTGSPIATDYTLAFVQASLPRGARHILEIGCGNGELAARLGEAGFAVVAVDSDQGCVDAARASGVDARLGHWPEPVAERFDAVLFTRSLHHINALDEAIAAAVGALAQDGRIIVEDFKFELDSGRSRRWFDGIIEDLARSGLLTSATAPADILERQNFGDEHHELHASSAIHQALATYGNVTAEDAAYYFRYAEPEVSTDTAGQVLRRELDAIAAGEIDALGRRFVLTPG